VARECPIDFNAGPSEIVVLSSRGRPDWIAWDMVAQAEHDPDVRAILITPVRRLAAAVARQLDRIGRTVRPAARALARGGGVILTATLQEAVELANRIAPEHLVCDDERTARAIVHAGAVFVGGYSAQAAGDYATGSNHVLPTGGAARSRGGLSAADYVRISSVQRLTRGGLSRIAPAAMALAGAEGLSAHAASIRIRLARHRRTGDAGRHRS
jgi:histidinol dehydrogenase